MSHGGTRLHILQRHKIEHIDLPVHSKTLVMLKNIKRIREIIQQRNIDIVHVRSRAPLGPLFMPVKKQKHVS